MKKPVHASWRTGFLLPVFVQQVLSEAVLHFLMEHAAIPLTAPIRKQ